MTGRSAHHARAGTRLTRARSRAHSRRQRALAEPAKRIADNAGSEGLVVLGRILESGCALGFNAASQTFEDLEEAGIIDPTKVPRAALQNAASVASLLLTAEAMIARRSKTRRYEQHFGA